jgi:hypothetical protein
MAHPQNKHHRFVIGMKKGLKRASIRWFYRTFEKLDRSNMDSVRLAEYEADYIKDTKIFRDTTTRRGHTGEHGAFIGEKAAFKTRKANETLKNLEYAYEPVKAYDMEYLFV